jgi:catechol 2,3-dioxygenase-like lactoylglutathione lyase family enzyme
MQQIQAGAIAALLSASAFAQPIQAKLDHITIVVHDLEAARLVYSALGFSTGKPGRNPSGTANSGGHFRDGGYLELVNPYDASLPAGSHFGELLKKGEGPAAASLEIASAEQAVHDLKAAGLETKGPMPGTLTRPGSTAPPVTLWWTVTFVQPLDSRPISMVQYSPDTLVNLEKLAHTSVHPNAASSLSAILIAVKDPEKSAAAYGNIGTLSTREIELKELGAIAKEIVLARGSIFLLRPTDPSGPTARRLKNQGEGILGVRLAVTDLDQTRKLIGDKNISKDSKSVLISPENAAGAWLQFQ